LLIKKLIIGLPRYGQREGLATPHYSFHFKNGRRVCSDANGLDLPDDAAARKEAELTARDLWNDPGENYWGGWIIEVTDEKGRRVISISVDPRLR